MLVLKTGLSYKHYTVCLSDKDFVYRITFESLKFISKLTLLGQEQMKVTYTSMPETKC